ncbi:MAG: 3-oxoadipate enol-lactonase [Alphaproteobacteria bacterium]|nr:3-oxoadipate enol-lactonase [Alphaproteobacteria bacterium]
MPDQHVNGARIHYRFDGPEGAPLVVMAHSLAATLGMWDAQMPALTRDHRVLRVDMRGHGGSEATPGPYRQDMLAEDFRALLAHLGLGPVHFIGLSMGGMIGMTLASAHPGMVRSLVLCDTMCEVPEASRAAFDERVAIARRDGMAALVEPTIARWFTPPYVARNPPALAAVRADIAATPVVGYAGCCEAIKTLDLRGRIGAIAVPTLVIVGRDDPATPVAAAEVIHRTIPGSELVVLDAASHLSNIEQPAAFDAALGAFLARRR